MTLRILFICSRNQWRSPTAEKLWRNANGILVRSAGTSPKARRTVSEADIRWADVIFAMEPKHKQQLKQKFSTLLAETTIQVLNIPDEYGYMDPELIEMLQDEVEAYLKSIQVGEEGCL